MNVQEENAKNRNDMQLIVTLTSDTHTTIFHSVQTHFTNRVR